MRGDDHGRRGCRAGCTRHVHEVGFVFVTAEYNHGIPGQLKNALDYLYDEWADNAAGIVNHGSSSAGSRAAESLKPLLGALRRLR